MRLFVLVRHGQSELNAARRVNGDPSVPVQLTAQGRDEAAALAVQLTGFGLDLCVHTRFERTRETAEIALADATCRSWSSRCSTTSTSGDLEGRTIDDYRAWKRGHTRSDAFPGGESLDAAALRYADAYASLLARPERRILVVCHEIPVRYAVNAAAGSDELDGPAHEIRNCVPTSSTRTGSARAVARMRSLVR